MAVKLTGFFFCAALLYIVFPEFRFYDGRLSGDFYKSRQQ